MKKKQKQKLPVRLTDAELVDRRKAQGKAQVDLEKEEDAARASARKHKALVKTATSTFHELARVVSSGEELRDVEVERHEDGLLYRLDTGELVKESFGSAEDRTLPLPLDEGDDLGEPAEQTPSGVVLESPAKKAKGKGKLNELNGRMLLEFMKPGAWYDGNALGTLAGVGIVELEALIDTLVNSAQLDEVKHKGKLQYRRPERPEPAEAAH